MNERIQKFSLTFSHFMTSYLRHAAKSDSKALCVVHDLSEKKRNTFIAYIEICLVEVRHYRQCLITGGGVEDTRLEAKDTKKNPRPRPRTAFPRTNTLEAKDRNARGQGQEPRTQAQVLSKKKGLHKNFSGDLHKKTFSKNFFKRCTKF